jgi:hypothetical protein
MKKMSSCKHATELMSQKQDRELNFKEQTWLLAHLSLCANCRRFNKQLDIIEKACEERREELEKPE